MSQCVLISSEGFVQQSTMSADSCTGFILISPDEYALAASSIEIDPAQATTVFGIAFGWVVMLGAIAYQIKVAKNTVRKA